MPSFSVLADRARQVTERLQPGNLLRASTRNVAVVTCMDARFDTYELLGVDPSEAYLLRNAGGRVTDDVLRSLAVATTTLDTYEIAVVQHAGCGMAALTEDQMLELVRESTGRDIPEIDFRTIMDLRTSLNEDVTRIAASPLMPPAIPVWGGLLDLDERMERVAQSKTGA